jgi:hypothetical protein
MGYALEVLQASLIELHVLSFVELGSWEAALGSLRDGLLNNTSCRMVVYYLPLATCSQHIFLTCVNVPALFPSGLLSCVEHMSMLIKVRKREREDVLVTE